MSHSTWGVDPVFQYLSEHPSNIYYFALIPATLFVWAVTFRVRRKIAGLRWQLQDIGITDAEDILNFVRRLIDAKRLKSDSAMIETAFVDLTQGVAIPDRRGMLGHLSGLISRIRGFFNPYTLHKSNEETLKRYLGQICQYFQTFQTLRRAGQLPSEDEEYFVLRRLLAKTSFGEVWLAESRDNSESREFYFFTDTKRLSDVRAQREVLPRKFKHTANDPHIVQFYKLGFYRKRIPFIEFEYLPGLSLKNWILADAEERLELQPDQIMRGLIFGLAAAHDGFVYHQCIEPNKILLSERFDPKRKPEEIQAKLSELCIGSVTGDADWYPVLDDSRAAAGGPQSRKFNSMYLPPEVELASDESSKPQMDVYALGIIWYQLLVGRLERPPYDFADRLKDMKVDAQTVKRVSRCLAHADRRYENARKLADDFSKAPAIAAKAPAARQVIIGHYDVSELLTDYLRSAEQETFPPIHEAETAVRPRVATQTL